MFGWVTGFSVPTATQEPEKERKPPAAATPLDFPVYNLAQITEDEVESTLHNLYHDLASIKRPQDLCPERFKSLNLKLEQEVPALQIVPRDCQFSPPLPWEDAPTTDAAGEPALMSNENPYPAHSRFDVVKDELLLNNDDAFREVARMAPRDGRERVRVTQTRKFWTGLERMAQYWDTSLDHYYERPATPQQTPQEGEDEMQVDGDPEVSDRQEKSDTSMDLDNQPAVQASGDQPQSESEGQTPSVAVYTGRRIGAGHEMPEEARDETIRAFAEMAAWPFGCQVTVPMVPPRLAVQTMLFPVRHSFLSARSPKDRQLARSGVMEGPVLVAQCRPEISFRGPEDSPGSGIGEVSDIYREVGGMLLAAQERAREGMTEVRPGEGKWWATTPRWGGAPNDDGMDEEVDKSEDKPLMDTGKARKRSRYDHPFTASRRPSRKMTNNERWRIVQPGPSLWDRRMRYIQIGKKIESPFDDVYMLSSVNHHLAVLHLRVHRRYLDILTTGQSEFPAVSDVPDQPWHVLKLRRTRWYNLLDANDRIEAFRAVWSVYHHSSRKTFFATL